MKIGPMRRRASLQSPPQETEAQNQYGEVATAWADVAEVWVQVEPLSGKELWQAQQVQADVTHRVTMRYRPGVRPKWRIVYQGRVFNILYVLNLEERNRTLQLLCVEQT